MRVPKIILADGQPIVLAGLRSLTAGFCEIVGEAHDGRTLMTAALSLKPDLIILPVGMPKLNGLEAGRRIKAQWPEAKLLFFTVHADIVYLREALKAGGRGYVLKTSSLDELRSAIDTVLTDGIHISSVFGRDAVPSLRSGKPTRAAIHLSERQLEILQLITEGQSNKEIAAALEISIKTVDFHRARMMQTLGVHTAAELAVAALRNRLVVESEPPLDSGDILAPQALEALWRNRLDKAKSRLDYATDQLKGVQEELQPAAAPSDGHFALRKAAQEERTALSEYRRLQQLYNKLMTHGEIPDSVEGSITYPGSPDPEE